MKLLSHTPLILLLLITFSIPAPADAECRDQCGTLEIHYPLGIDDGCGAPQFRHMFTCNFTSQSLFFITPNGNYKVQSIDYKAQTMTVYDPDMSTCTILQPHHDVVLTDIQYAIIPPSPDTVFALLNCSVDSPILHHYRFLCFDLPGHKCQDLYSSCNSFKVFTSAGTLGAPYNFPITGGSGSPSVGFGTPGAPTNLPGSGSGGFGAPTPPNNNLPGTGIGGFGAPSPPNNNLPGTGIGGFDAPSPPNNNLPGSGIGGFAGTPGAPSNLPDTPGVYSKYEETPPSYFGAPNGNVNGSISTSFGPPSVPNTYPGAPSVPNTYPGAPSVSNNIPGGPDQSLPPCCFTGYSTVKVMSMNILDCTHFTSFYNTDKLKGVGPMDWSYGLKFSYSLPDMGCERCSKSGGRCGYDTETEALLCLCSAGNNSTRECGEGSDSGANDLKTPSKMKHALFTSSLGLFFLIYPWI